jgi:DNA repair exonuclease SbcCD ATPase subunit
MNENDMNVAKDWGIGVADKIKSLESQLAEARQAMKTWEQGAIEDKATIDKLTAERDAIRYELQKADKWRLEETTALKVELDKFKGLAGYAICSYCGHKTKKNAEDIAAHLATCEKHPWHQSELEISRLEEEFQLMMALKDKRTHELIAWKQKAERLTEAAKGLWECKDAPNFCGKHLNDLEKALAEEPK